MLNIQRESQEQKNHWRIVQDCFISFLVLCFNEINYDLVRFYSCPLANFIKFSIPSFIRLNSNFLCLQFVVNDSGCMRIKSPK